ncbi:MAG: hypothetical protein EBW54_11775, partial [Betaproteobacteria bacterium]|nr:hypothetical protein [Betaproteobacteria bacterium]
MAALEAAHPDVVARFKYEQPGSRRFLVKTPPKQAQAKTQAPIHPPTQPPTQKPPQEPLEKAQGALTSDAAKPGAHLQPGTRAQPTTAQPMTAQPTSAPPTSAPPT